MNLSCRARVQLTLLCCACTPGGGAPAVCVSECVKIQFQNSSHVTSFNALAERRARIPHIKLIEHKSQPRDTQPQRQAQTRPFILSTARQPDLAGFRLSRHHTERAGRLARSAGSSWDLPLMPPVQPPMRTQRAGPRHACWPPCRAMAAGVSCPHRCRSSRACKTWTRPHHRPRSTGST